MKKGWLLIFISLMLTACLPKDQTPEIDPDENEEPENQTDILITQDYLMGV